MFVGRTEESGQLEDAYQSQKSELVVIYGRRRIGKSALIQKFFKLKPHVFSFEALEGEKTSLQIAHFKRTLATQLNDRFVNNMMFSSWSEIFQYISEKVIESSNRQEKLIISFDEIQWMAAQRNQLISIIKYFWDNHWKKQNTMLILCGSIASFMVNKILKSKALYGRVNLEILLGGLSPSESSKMFQSKRDYTEQLKYLMVLGGVPKYLEEISLNHSFNENINRLFFSKNGLFVKEIDRIFYSQFKEARTYLKIVQLLKDSLFSLQEIALKLKISSGGSLRSYLQNLQDAEFITQYISFEKPINSKIKKYGLSDEYLRFFFRFITPNIKSINTSKSKRLFETLCEKSFNIWLGFAFERFCIKNSNKLSELLGIQDKIINAGPYFAKSNPKFQIDLLFLRMDNVITLCEIKHHQKYIQTNIIPEVQRKCDLVNVPRGYSIEKTLISLHGPDKSLKESRFFDHYITADQFFVE